MNQYIYAQTEEELNKKLEKLVSEGKINDSYSILNLDFDPCHNKSGKTGFMASVQPKPKLEFFEVSENDDLGKVKDFYSKHHILSAQMTKFRIMSSSVLIMMEFEEKLD